MTMQMTAWVDESGSNVARDPGTYIMSAAITSDDQEQTIHEYMARLLLPGQLKLHWRDEGAIRRSQITSAIGAIDVEHLVVVTSPHPVDCRTERRRRLTLEILLLELAALGVDRVVIESRGAKDDQRDRKMLDYLRQQGVITTALRLDHRIGRQEPLLWIPDALCGIVVAYRCGDARYYDEISHKVTLAQVPPRSL